MVAPLLCSSTVFWTAAGRSDRWIFFSCPCIGKTIVRTASIEAITIRSNFFIGTPSTERRSLGTLVREGRKSGGTVHRGSEGDVNNTKAQHTVNKRPNKTHA